MGICAGRVVVITGAGRGIGREHAIEFARQGAKVVVNDLGAEVDGTGRSEGPAGEVVDEIRGMGAEAVANGDDVSDYEGAGRLVNAAIDTFGGLDVLVNNAGILRDRMLVNMTVEEWDAVIRVHLRGTFAPMRHAVEYWRKRTKAGETNDARIINTTSPSGIYGNVGQTNYGAAKAGIASMTVIAAMELGRYGVTVNAIAPAALTRMTENLGMGEPSARKPEEFDARDPGNIAPLVVWLGSAESAGITGRVFNVRGDTISVAEGWVAGPSASKGDRWDPAELGGVVPALVAKAAPNANMGEKELSRMSTDSGLNRDGPGRDGSPALPDRQEMDEAIHVIKDNADRLFLWNYDRDRGQLVTLYNKAMGSQWNSVTDLDWATDVDPEQLVAEQDSPLLAVTRIAGTLPGSPLHRWNETQYKQLGIEFLKASLSQFMHGEQGAMMTAAKIVETVPWIDAKYYASTQTMDEARHTEVFAKYLSLKLGEAYPMSPFLKTQIWSLLEDSRWDIAYLGMQIVIESLALAAFGDMLRRTEEPLLKKLLRYVMSDEARHVAFGVLTLSEFYADLSEAELLERQEFMVDATLNSRSRATTPEVWERMGVDYDAVVPFIMEAAGQAKINPARGFARGFFAKLVPNTRKLGLLDANNGYLRNRWGEAGLLEFEFADDTGSDYETYDAVAADRAATTS